MLLRSIALMGGGSSADLPTGALGVWYMDQYQASPRPVVRNAANSVSPSANLFAASRRLFNNAEFWTGTGCTIVDATVTAPDGSSDASTCSGTGNWLLRPTRSDTIPAGTYTAVANVKRNTGTDQSFCFTKDNTVTRSGVNTATSAWQRTPPYTFTLGIPSTIDKISICSIDGVTAANLQICDFELYAGSSDLGPQVLGAHLYPGTSAFDSRAAYSGGVLDLTSNGFGLIQFSTATAVSTLTVMAVVSKTAAATTYESILSSVQSYQDPLVTVDVNNIPSSTLKGAGTKQQLASLLNFNGMGWHTITLRWDGTNVDYFVDDVRLLRNVATPSAAASVIDLFVNEVNSSNLYGKLKFNSVVYWPRALSDGERGSAERILRTRAAVSGLTVTPINRVMIFEGDSITGAFAYSVPYLYFPNASPTIVGANYAVTGSTLTDLTARIPLIDGIVPSNTAGRTFALYGQLGANDLNGAMTNGQLDTWLANWTAYFTARRLSGRYGKLVVGTVFPSSQAARNSNRNYVNPFLRLWPSQGIVDATIDYDTAANSNGTDAAGSDVAKFPDGLHPTAAVQATYEAVARPVLNGF